MENEKLNQQQEEEMIAQEQPEEEAPQEERPYYVPRPLWQVVGAWVGLIAFVAVIVFYYINMMRGG